jgi:hypothetical protein
MSETTYERYYRVLREIADGCSDPAERAAQAIASHKKLLSDTERENRQKAERAMLLERREQSAANRRECCEIYNEWLIAGRPPIATFAKTHGLKRSTMWRRLQRAERGMPRGTRRLWWADRDPKSGYPTEQEIWDREDKA